MFIQTWNKYLPIIKILMKRSVNGDQSLEMNSTDFQRAAGGRKIKFSFSIELVKGRMRNILAPAPLARDLITALEQDEVTYALLRKQEFELIMSSDFKLKIKNCTPPPVVVVEEATETVSDAETEPAEEVSADETKDVK
jgi:hypothetical protein